LVARGFSTLAITTTTHGHSAIAESGYAKADSVTVYSVGLSAGVDGQKILERVASPGKSYKATAEDLEVIFQTIAGNIAYAATDALMTDPIGEMFSIPGVTVDNYTSLITVNQGTIIYNTETETIELVDSLYLSGFPSYHDLTLSSWMIQVQKAVSFIPPTVNAT